MEVWIIKLLIKLFTGTCLLSRSHVGEVTRWDEVPYES